MDLAVAQRLEGMPARRIAVARRGLNGPSRVIMTTASQQPRRCEHPHAIFMAPSLTRDGPTRSRPQTRQRNHSHGSEMDTRRRRRNAPRGCGILRATHEIIARQVVPPQRPLAWPRRPRPPRQSFQPDGIQSSSFGWFMRSAHQDQFVGSELVLPRTRCPCLRVPAPSRLCNSLGMACACFSGLKPGEV